jgi:hypothetical protein
MKKLIKLIVEIIFLLGTIYSLSLFAQAIETINFVMPL